MFAKPLVAIALFVALASAIPAPESFPKFGENAVGTNWAVLVAGSNYYYN